MTPGKIVAWVMSHLAAVAIAGGLVYLMVERAHLSHELEKLKAEQQKSQAAAATQQGFQTVTPTSSAKTEAALSPEAKAELAAIRKSVKDTSVAVHALTEASFKGTSQGHLTPATATTAPVCSDAFNRFTVNTASCEFAIRQKFRLEATVLRGVDGKTRFFKERLVELDPVTGVALPGDPPQLTSNVQITEEKAPEPGPFHQRLVASVNERGSFGAGLKFVSVGSFDASLLGFYDVGHKAVRGAIQPGWRIRLPWIDSTISVGPNLFIDSAGNSGLGAGATIELTR